jgi:hypothetical protein
LRRLILVADRGLLSLDNLDELRKLTLPSGQALEFILAVPGRRYSEFVDLLNPLQQQCTEASAEITAEVAWNDLRLMLAHDPATALEQRQKRQSKMNELQTQANAWVGKLDEQDQGSKKRGRKLSVSVVNEFTGLIFTIGEGRDGGAGGPTNANGADISAGAVGF